MQAMQLEANDSRLDNANEGLTLLIVNQIDSGEFLPKYITLKELKESQG